MDGEAGLKNPTPSPTFSIPDFEATVAGGVGEMVLITSTWDSLSYLGPAFRRVRTERIRFVIDEL